MAVNDRRLAGLGAYIQGARPRFEALLGQMVETPTVSADPAHAADIRKGAALAKQVIEGLGGSAEVVDTAGNPVIVGRLGNSAGARTLTIYNHMDVQPAQEPEWTAEPFRFQVKDGRYFGRGSTDDKGPALSTLFAARYALDAGIPLNIRFLWELEEEIGSPNFAGFLTKHAADLRTDSVLVSDTVWLSRETPAMPYGLRGLQAATLSLDTAERDAHSGLTGGAARNPIGELAQAISRCYDARTGRVLIPGFYDDVRPVDEDELRNFLASGFTLPEFKRGHGLRLLRTEDVREVLTRIWCSPTFEVHGIAGGYQGPGVKTVVPAKAEAKVSMRMVPDQDPARALRLLEAFIREINPDVTVKPHGSLKAYVGEFRGPYIERARDAMQWAFGKRPALIREGGSIGAVVTMAEVLKAPIVFIGLSLPEHGYHAPNEYFDWGQASGGMKALVKYMVDIAAL
jgi:acetylornithine deacetylase/succinyl-diaminopimelate desuccinylase-like protein